MGRWQSRQIEQCSGILADMPSSPERRTVESDTAEFREHITELRRNEMKSIRRKITVCLMATVLIALVAVGASSIFLSYRSTMVTVDQMMGETAVLAAERIEQELTAYRNVAMDTGCISQLSDPAVSVDEK